MKKPKRLLHNIKISSPQVLKDAAAIITGGGIVAFPTETYYGLAVDPFNEKALARLFKVKQRPSEKAILNLIESQDQLVYFTEKVDDIYLPIMAKFWPGPLTLLLRARPGLSKLLTCDSGTVGVRISSHQVALELCRQAGQPITATSANLSGQKAATTAKDVAVQLGSTVDLIIDGGKTPGGKGSTIVGTDGAGLRLIRDGVVDYSKLKNCYDTPINEQLCDR